MGGFMADRAMGMTGYMQDRTSERALREAVNADNKPIWSPSLDRGQAAQGIPAMINEWPYVVNNHMDNMGAANRKPIMFGNFSYYGCRNVTGIDFYRFFDSRTVQSYSVQFIAFARRDAKCIGPIVSSASDTFIALNTVA